MFCEKCSMHSDTADFCLLLLSLSVCLCLCLCSFLFLFLVTEEIEKIEIKLGVQRGIQQHAVISLLSFSLDSIAVSVFVVILVEFDKY